MSGNLPIIYDDILASILKHTRYIGYVFISCKHIYLYISNLPWYKPYVHSREPVFISRLFMYGTKQMIHPQYQYDKLRAINNAIKSTNTDMLLYVCSDEPFLIAKSFIAACKKGNLSIVIELYERHNITSITYNEGMQIACEYNRGNVITHFGDKGLLAGVTLRLVYTSIEHDRVSIVNYLINDIKFIPKRPLIRLEWALAKKINVKTLLFLMDNDLIGSASLFDTINKIISHNMIRPEYESYAITKYFCDKNILSANPRESHLLMNWICKYGHVRSLRYVLLQQHSITYLPILIYCSCKYNRADMFEYILQNKASIISSQEKLTVDSEWIKQNIYTTISCAMFSAAEQGNVDIIRIAYENETTITLRISDLKIHAVRYNRYNVLTYLNSVM